MDGRDQIWQPAVEWPYNMVEQLKDIYDDNVS